MKKAVSLQEMLLDRNTPEYILQWAVETASKSICLAVVKSPAASPIVLQELLFSEFEEVREIARKRLLGEYIEQELEESIADEIETNFNPIRLIPMYYST